MRAAKIEFPGIGGRRKRLSEGRFERIRQEFGFPGDDRVIAKCFLLWAGVLGAISLEVFGQYGADTLTDPAAVFDTQLRLLVDVLSQHE